MIRPVWRAATVPLAGMTGPGYNGSCIRHLRRLERVWLEHPIYFVTTCTSRRRSILATDVVAAVLADEWHAAGRRHGWAIGRYVIMPDHVHFFCAAEPDAKPLPKFMQLWKQWTSKRLVRELKIPSAIWQEAFFDHVLRSSESYDQKWNYVRENPFRAGLVANTGDWLFQGENRRSPVVAGIGDPGWSGASPPFPSPGSPISATTLFSARGRYLLAALAASGYNRRHLNMNAICRRVSLLLLVLLFAAAGWPADAQEVRNIAEREIGRRQAAILQGQGAVARGRLALEAKDFAKAHDEFRAAVNLLPDSLAAADEHDAAMQGFCESGVKLAEQRIAEGKYGEAEQIVREVVSDRYDPNCRAAAELLAHLSEPGYFNKTMGSKFIAKVEDVKKLLSDADGYYNSGRYDLAFKKYEQVLNLDPYNVAARRGEERINLTKIHYGEEAYNETRSRQLWQLQKGWEQPVRQYGQSVGPITDAFARDAGGTARITNKLNSIIIPKIEFRDASIREAIDFLRQQAAANDPSTEGKRGVDIVLRTTQLGRAEAPAPAPETAPPLPGAAPEAGVEPTPVPIPAAPSIAPSDARITITLNQIPLGEALRYIASQAGLKVKVEPYAISVIPINEQSADLYTKEYRVPPGFISSSVNVGANSLDRPATKVGQGGGSGRDTQESTGGQQLVNRQTALDFLKDQGVPFPTGASANFLPQSSRLIVRNTEENLELVDALVEQANVAGPKQVEIEAKFVEISQNNLKELGFDWLLGQFNIGNQRVFGGGGTSGTGQATNPVDFPFVAPNGVPVGQFPVTGGNRSGQLAITANAIDALLFGVPGASSLAPGIFGLSGVFTDPQFQVVVRALNQKKGVDLLSAPRVTTKSGQRAVIEIVREFRYPTQFDPPKIPDTTGSLAVSGQVGATSSNAFPVTPTTPTGFETRNTGVTLEVEPVVGPDGVTIDLNLVPQVVEFEGFINYGSPIQTFSTNALGVTTTQVLTPNVINQPIFNSRKVTTSVSVWDGQTVVLGGLMREDVQKTEDRTPIIGDIPLVGRLFRTNTEQHIKRNLVIFVTARLVNPAGQPINSLEEEEETETVSQLEPPVLPQVPYYKK